MLSCWGKRNVPTRKIVDNAMFVVGPAMAVFPMLFVSAYPEIMTAPGDMILKSGVIVEISVRIAPVSVSLNSAHRPCVCAVILWAISCRKNDVVSIVVKVASIT